MVELYGRKHMERGMYILCFRILCITFVKLRITHSSYWMFTSYGLRRNARSTQVKCSMVEINHFLLTQVKIYCIKKKFDTCIIQSTLRFIPEKMLENKYSFIFRRTWFAMRFHVADLRIEEPVLPSYSTISRIVNYVG